MKTKLTENEAIKKAFCDAHLSRERGGTGDVWQSQVMRRVRQIGPLRARKYFLPALEQMVWRLAPVNCALIILLIILFLKMGLDPGSDVLAMLTLEAEEPSLSQLFGIGG